MGVCVCVCGGSIVLCWKWKCLSWPADKALLAGNLCLDTSVHTRSVCRCCTLLMLLLSQVLYKRESSGYGILIPR